MYNVNNAAAIARQRKRKPEPRRPLSKMSRYPSRIKPYPFSYIMQDPTDGYCKTYPIHPNAIGLYWHLSQKDIIGESLHQEHSTQHRGDV